MGFAGIVIGGRGLVVTGGGWVLLGVVTGGLTVSGLVVVVGWELVDGASLVVDGADVTGGFT